MTSWGWRKLTVISPVVDGEAKVKLSNPIVGQRIEVELNSLLELLELHALGIDNSVNLQEYLAEQGFLVKRNSDYISDLEHWEKRGWGQVLDYYLWSCVLFGKRVNKESNYSNSLIDVNIKSLTIPVDLPEDMILGEVILRRRTLRRYADRLLAESHFSGLLWYGLKSLRNPSVAKVDKSHTFVIFVAVYAVEGIEPGLYRYYPDSHGLELLVKGALREQISHLLFGQNAPLTAACSVFLGVDLYDYACFHPGEGSLRALFIEVGRIGHELLIGASALGLGGLTAPAMRDREAEQLLPLEKSQRMILYTLTFGESRTSEMRDDFGNSNTCECSHSTNL
ncbi:SagB/ThcOx family dehydrogenase [Paenibacillus polysaccharolyticus]|uniref:SagB/ThcOx family dehydrogenase n=1 Tax=Paenibacillus polysaccharolyticus TaxID=582692 RepID=UPI00209F977B|nr:SagB/ThcOx family dehydrogenase [Paenibacillus polysaccharolyticus]MCP1133372.1 SagB/ThcOx family dehydrogenase [Paenibacillus polysaccharolyticus]